MAGSCWELYNWLATGCELNNTQTMSLELAIAFIGATVIAFIFYSSENKQRKISDDLIANADKILTQMKPIIEKQGKIIEENEKQKIERIQKLLHELDPLLSGLINDVESELADFEDNNGKPNEYLSNKEIIENMDSFMEDCKDISKMINYHEDIVPPKIFEILKESLMSLAICRSLVSQEKTESIVQTYEGFKKDLKLVWSSISETIH